MTRPDGVYWECDPPIENFLLDPPFPMEHLAVRGLRTIRNGGIIHLLDCIGGYPNVADFIEEARRFGVRRQLSILDWSLITPKSRLLLAHVKGWIVNYKEYMLKSCPKHLHTQSSDLCCVGLYWQDITGGIDTGDGDVVVKGAGFTYHGQGKTTSEVYQPAIFMSVPCTRIAEIKGGTKQTIWRANDGTGTPG